MLSAASASVADIQSEKAPDHSELVLTCGADGVLCIFEAQRDLILEQARKFSMQYVKCLSVETASMSVMFPCL